MTTPPPSPGEEGSCSCASSLEASFTHFGGCQAPSRGFPAAQGPARHPHPPADVGPPEKPQDQPCLSEATKGDISWAFYPRQNEGSCHGGNASLLPDLLLLQPQSLSQGVISLSWVYPAKKFPSAPHCCRDTRTKDPCPAVATRGTPSQQRRRSSPLQHFHLMAESC